MDNLLDTMSLEDFCKSIEFIAPQGTTIDFFIAPETEDKDQSIDRNLSSDDMNLVEKVVSKPSNTTVYFKKDLSTIQNDGSGVFSPISMAGESIVNTPKIAKTTDDPLFTNGGIIPPNRKLYDKNQQEPVLAQTLKECVKIRKNMILLEKDFGKFKKGTLVVLRDK